MTDPTVPAVLFLDVDGTLIPFQRRQGDDGSTPIADSVDSSMPAANPLLSRLDPAHGPQLMALGCPLVWATAWRDEANDVISPRLGLPILPAVAWSDGPEPPVTGRLHWKTPELVAWADGRTFVWVDDEITEVDRTWVAARHSGDALLHRVDANVGLTDADFTAIGHWLARLDARTQ
jgi:HAD domain in Swiss Army Knife RNA repair proteins